MPVLKSIAKVTFFFLVKNPLLKNRRLLKRFLPHLFQKEKKSLVNLDVIFCSDEYLLRINKQYLNHDDFTDIITFDLSERPTAIQGEIYISLDRILENSFIYNCPPSDELHRVIFHGSLHLCGYTDKSSLHKKTMRLKENEYLAQYKRYVSRETRST